MTTPGSEKNRHRKNYRVAARYCDRVTQRVVCISRALEEDPLSSDGLTPEVQDRVATALSNHIINCET